MEKEKVDVIVIGAGVIGLSIAAKIAAPGRSLYVLEKNDTFGGETSSRNSEVIHAGIYYEHDSLKAKTCVQGNKLLYELCEKAKIPFKKTGKVIVATNHEEEAQLEKLFAKGRSNGVDGLEMLGKGRLKKIEPYVKALSAIFSADTGIIDSHRLMKYFISVIMEKHADIAYNTEVVAIKKSGDGYEVRVKDSDGDEFSFAAQTVINCAGLNSDKVAAMAGIDIEKEDYGLKYCKGQYFRIANSQKCRLVNGLVYPVPHMEKGGLGIHATVDLSGSVRLGPDTQYLKDRILDYSVAQSQLEKFFNSAVQFLSFLEKEDLVPDTAGIRPKLQGENEGFRDFVIKEETRLGYPGFINLIGIESPGLTAAISISDCVKNLLR